MQRVESINELTFFLSRSSPTSEENANAASEYDKIEGSQKYIATLDQYEKAFKKFVKFLGELANEEESVYTLATKIYGADAVEDPKKDLDSYSTYYKHLSSLKDAYNAIISKKKTRAEAYIAEMKADGAHRFRIQDDSG